MNDAEPLCWRRSMVWPTRTLTVRLRTSAKAHPCLPFLESSGPSRGSAPTGSRPGLPVEAHIETRHDPAPPGLYRTAPAAIVRQDIVGKERPRAKAGARTDSDLGAAAVAGHGAPARQGDARRALDGDSERARDPCRVFVADVSALRRFPSRHPAEDQRGLRRQGRGALRPPRLSAR